MTAPPEIRSPCIFCRKEAADSESRAHILPESLVEDSPFLAPGLECDRCNRKLSRMEQIFINDYLGSFYRVLYLGKTKKEKPPAADWASASVRAVDTPDGRRTIQILIRG